MLVSVNIEDIKDNKTELRGIYNNKNITPSIEVVCNKDNIGVGLEKLLPVFRTKKTKVLHISYEGELSYLEEVLFSGDYSDVPVVVKKKLSEVGQVDLILAGLPKNVRLVIKIDSKLDNIMKIVNGYSQKYENLSFCGEHLIALKGCRLGCTEKVTKNLIAQDGCYMGYKKIDISDIEDAEFVEAANKGVKRSKKS